MGGADERPHQHPHTAVQRDACGRHRADHELTQVQRIALRMLPECFSNLGSRLAHDLAHDLVGVGARERTEFHPLDIGRRPQRHGAGGQHLTGPIGGHHLHRRIRGELGEQPARRVVEMLQIVDEHHERPLVGGPAREDVFQHHREHAQLLRAIGHGGNVVAGDHPDQRTERHVTQGCARDTAAPAPSGGEVVGEHLLRQSALADSGLAGDQDSGARRRADDLAQPGELFLAQQEAPGADGSRVVPCHRAETLVARRTTDRGTN